MLARSSTAAAEAASLLAAVVAQRSACNGRGRQAPSTDGGRPAYLGPCYGGGAGGGDGGGVFVVTCGTWGTALPARGVRTIAGGRPAVATPGWGVGRFAAAGCAARDRAAVQYT